MTASGFITVVARPTAAPRSRRRVPLTARAAAQHAGDAPAALARVTEASGNVPGASAFQSAL